MSELTFAKSFLSTLDSRPIKLRGDHVFDPEQVGLRVPYTLPRLQAPHPEMPKKVKQAQAPGSSKSITIHVKSARNPALEFSLPNSPLSTTTVQDLKDAVRQRVTDAQGNAVALDKIKILCNKKPVAGTGKTVAEILADEPGMLVGGKEVEFKVMIIGGAKTIDVSEAQPATEAHQASPPKPAVGPSGLEVVQTEAFWDDLQGYLEQRLKDMQEAKRLRVLFKDAWTSNQ
ncbi:Cell-cycle control medial ring component [Penicillium odoratum]|uniref:Cell-cycle control medial ring component n=1 Tax=Penicillium odoratum TaxID=1167516 RepID=UPI002546DDE7|nr:Cell-cycle control medial ring component [Penicillium odoratum]KAJ5765094.1 Cell-cycle control medial ring component [Penicillium odoratum]